MGNLVKIRKVVNGAVVETREVDDSLVDIILGLSQPAGTYLEIAPPDIMPGALVPPDIQFAKSIDDMSMDEIKELLVKRGIKFHPAVKSREKLINLARISL